MQVIQYADRMLQLAAEVLGLDLYPEFRQRLAEAKGNVEEHGDGATIADNWIKPAEAGLLEFGAHYALSSLFEDYEDEIEIFSCSVESISRRMMVLGKASMAVGVCRVESRVVGESMEIAYAAVYPGDHNVRVGVGSTDGPGSVEELTAAVQARFADADFPGLMNVIDDRFPDSVFTLRSMFRDEQRSVLSEILRPALERAEQSYSSVYESEAPIVRALVTMHSPVPPAFQTAATYFFNREIAGLLESPDTFDPERLRALLAEAAAVRAVFDTDGLGFRFSRLVSRLADELLARPADVKLLRTIGECVALSETSPLKPDLWELRNRVYGLTGRLADAEPLLAGMGDSEQSEWQQAFKSLAAALSVRV